MVARIIDEGYRKIMFIGEELYSVVHRSRYQGYLDAMASAGIPVPHEYVHLIASRDDICPAVQKIMDDGAECIICMDDFVCFHVLSSLNRLGWQIPQDVKIASLFNSVYLSNNIPPISAINFDAVGMGAMACEILLKSLAGETVPNKTLLNYEIVMTESVLNNNGEIPH
jgi:DNA-binding LacI/PurR family transcriptional regulator